MYLAPGTYLGPYEITSLLGAGGMGEVYKAHDSRLGRFVAVKVLLARDVADVDRRRRFAQEARAASALNHPGIVTVYDVGSESGVDYIAMELVEGKTLETLLPEGGFALEKLLRYAVQAADAIAKAHSASILHRDLKPSNLIVTGEEQVKVLDFGLAKLVQPSTGGEDQTTGSLAAITEEGRIIGTAAYMSPEQAEGKVLDSRSDIFSFGAVLYEMATGQRAFRGNSPISTIMCILRDEPKPMSQIRREVPLEFERLIQRCLMKDPVLRIQSMAELRNALEALREKSDAGKLRRTRFTPRSSAPMWWAGAATVLCGLLALAALRLLPLQRSNEPIGRPVPLTNYEGDERQPDFSPSGGEVAFSWNGERQDNWDIYLKVVGSSAAPLRLTTDPGSDSEPKWSPDGKAIAFVRSTRDGDAIMLTSALGGAERRLAEFPTAIDAGLSWSPDNKWLAVSAGDGKGITALRLVSAETGESRGLTTPPARSGGDFQPAFSPDGRSLAFVRERGMNVEDLWVLPLTGTYEPQGKPKRRLGDGKKNQGPAWSADGRDLIFSAGEAALAGMYRLAAEGSEPPTRIDALGDGVTEPAVSRTGDRLAFAHTFRTATIWRLDLANGASRRDKQPEQLIASSSFRNAFPQYSPDGKRIAFFSNRSGSNQIWTCNADGTRPLQITSMPGTTTGTPRWSPDGRWISFDSNSGGYWQVYVVDANGGKPRALTDGEQTNVVASWSRDGRWIYFTSRRSGTEEVWKIAAPIGKGLVSDMPVPTQVTYHGGTSSTESADGGALYFTKTTANFEFSLWRKDWKDGEEKEVIRSLHRYNFVVTDKSIYYATPSRSDAPAEVREVSLATGKETTLHRLNKRVDLGLAVSPDGRYLLYTQLDSSGSDLMTVDGFR